MGTYTKSSRKEENTCGWAQKMVLAHQHSCAFDCTFLCLAECSAAHETKILLVPTLWSFKKKIKQLYLGKDFLQKPRQYLNRSCCLPGQRSLEYSSSHWGYTKCTLLWVQETWLPKADTSDGCLWRAPKDPWLLHMTCTILHSSCLSMWSYSTAGRNLRCLLIRSRLVTCLSV